MGLEIRKKTEDRKEYPG